MNATNHSLPTPGVLGLKKSFGFGDRLGLATPGHLAAVQKSSFAPIFAQQSIREMERTQRTPEEVMLVARQALREAGFSGQWGADADHLKTEVDVQRTVSSGFTFFTIDPSAYVANDADQLGQTDLEENCRRMIEEKVLPAGWTSEYLANSYDVSEHATLQFDSESLHRAAVKYGRAIAHCEKMAGWIKRECGGRSFEIEISVDETDTPTSPLEHLFFGLELKRRNVKAVSLAPRFVGEFEKGIDYRGDLAEFENSLRQHVAIAIYCGPYKISVHSGSDKFTIYPIAGRVCGELLHVKTAGTSYLEALRVVCRKDKKLFREIVEFCRGRFETDRKSYHISTTHQEVTGLPVIDDVNTEKIFLDQRPGRQLLHVTFGSVLTLGKRPSGQTFKDAILTILRQSPDLHLELLHAHFARHLDLLQAG